MPKFVPVFDPEVPRSEQDPYSDKLLKHRKWDNPHVVIPSNRKDVDSDKHSTRKYFKDKYNDNNNLDNKRDDTFYRKNVYDEFDYAPKKKKNLSLKANDGKNVHDTHKDLKHVKKDHSKREYHENNNYRHKHSHEHRKRH
ncbi:uncharacterized protein TA08600 [Theileria annulata]|uniref:Uncharacterized protein n=1 Tax=Theileria annulata TaxID=5874 RepID=Q4U9J7_THEAN|nr:uncharacterized protein TA08600 [Theileria annulata]CAI76506.1 hypothetical protein TA08600 [Theileria annulata]|eukprot:XP_953131.1 hypothetical protein TA08600 [Theileria annulata]